jgi:cytochrome b561
VAKPANNFTAVAKWHHWLIALLMFTLLYEASNFWGRAPEDKLTAIPAHASVAALILILTLTRSAWRAGNPPPPMPHGTPGWMERGAKIGHGMLYGLIVWQGVIGIMLAAASPADIRLFSGFNLSDFGIANAQVYASLVPLHQAGAIAFGLVLVGHVAAALWHHFVLKDDVLARMLPFFGIVLKARGERAAAEVRGPSLRKGFDWKFYKNPRKRQARGALAP